MKYRMEDGTVINTEKAPLEWEEKCDWDGSNNISRATGTQWDHEKLYRSRRGRYYVEYWSQWQRKLPYCQWVDERKAVEWLLLNERDVPDDLKHLIDEVEE